MTTRKHPKKRSATHDAATDATEQDATDVTLTPEELAAQAESPAAQRAFERGKRTKAARKVPTYKHDNEVAAARAMYGAEYEKLIANGSIVAPTFEEVPQAELLAKLAKKDAKAEQAEAE